MSITYDDTSKKPKEKLPEVDQDMDCLPIISR